MSLQWTLIATFLYIEIAIIILMVLPIIRPRFWRKFFHSNFVKMLAAQSNLYLTAFIIILFLFFVESIREYRKYGEKIRHPQNSYGNPAAFYEDEMRLFRGQRNFFISGFALFSLFIIKRLATLISSQAFLQLENEVIANQARQVSAMASAPTEAEINAGEVDKLKESLAKVEKELEAKAKEVASLQKNNVALQKQADSSNKEYDRLTKEFQKLQNQKDSVVESSKDK